MYKAAAAYYGRNVLVFVHEEGISIGAPINVTTANPNAEKVSVVEGAIVDLLFDKGEFKFSAPENVSGGALMSLFRDAKSEWSHLPGSVVVRAVEVNVDGKCKYFPFDDWVYRKYAQFLAGEVENSVLRRIS